MRAAGGKPRLAGLLLAAATAVALAAGVARASAPIIWEYPPRDAGGGATGPDGVRPGPRDGESVEGIAVAQDGRLGLSVPMREVFPGSSKLTVPPLLWAAGLDADGNLFLGTGNSGEVLRIDRKGTASPLADIDDLGVRAVTAAPSGDLYFATFPEGAVYRARPGADPEPWYAPEERYLWALATDPSGRLFVATGERGIIYAIKGKGEGEVFFDSDESHVVSLAFDRDGNMIAGTDPDGLLYRISPDGKPQVLLDTDLREIPAVTVTPEGVIYAAAIGEEPVQQQRKPGEKSDLTIEITPAPDGNVLEEQSDLPRKISIDLAELLPSLTRGAEGVAGRIYRIEPGRAPVLVWKSDTQRVYSLAWAGDRGLFFGTGGAGNEARIYHLEEDGTASTLYRLAERQVTALVSQPDGRLYACTSNPGRVYLLDAGSVSAGTYVAPVQDAGRSAIWGALSWDAEAPPGTRIELSTRSGNRPSPDDSWSGWSAPALSSAGSPIQSPPARYLQWKAELSRITDDRFPVLRRVKLTSLPENRPPAIDGLAVMEPKTPYIKAGARPGTGAQTKPASGEDDTAAEKSGKDRMTPPAGSRWVVWNAVDPDGDALAQSVFLRAEDETSFRLIASDVSGSPYPLLDEDLAEGRYFVRIEVDDGPANGTERRLGDTLVSDRFLVDRTPPDLKVVTPGPPSPAGRVVFEVEARDRLGRIAGGEYSVTGAGAASWTPLPCRDGICDTAAERFLLDVPAGAASSRLTLRVSDAAGNTATIEVPPASR